jgi:hypothetical protein
MPVRPRLAYVTIVFALAAATPSCGGSEDATAPAPSTAESDLAAAAASASVLQHHNGPTRSGLYTDAALTRTSAAAVHRDATFNPSIRGDIRAQPLFVDGGATGKDLILVATEQNEVYALATTGAAVWSKKLGAPVPRSTLPCGNINPLGVTGTPVIDASSRTLYLDAMTTPDGGTTKKHLVYALSIDTGAVAPGWPVDVAAHVPGFDAAIQNQRSALALVAGNLFIPYGGHSGDCSTYHGWVVSIPVAHPAGTKGWATAATKGGAWAVGGLASDGTSMYVATGNTSGARRWGGGEAVIRFPASSGAVFSGKPTDFWAPPDWPTLDAGDTDVGSSNPVIVNVPGSTPSRLVFQLGKPKTAWLLDPANLGGIGNGFVAANGVTSGETAGAPVTYTTPKGTYVVVNAPCPGGGDVTALKIEAGSPPKVAHAWCANQHGSGSLAVSTTDGRSNFVVWGIGATGDNGAKGDDRLHGFDGDTGAVVYGGGAAADAMNPVGRFQSPMIAKGHIYVGANGQLNRFR